MTVSKTLLNPASEYQPGASVSFRLRLNIPSGDTRNIVFNDYFPLPALGIAGFDTTLDLSANTSISHGPNDTLGFNPTSITTDATSNSVSIAWPDVDSNKAEVIEIDIRAQVISTDPFADGLFLTNVFEQTATNTAGETSSLYDGSNFYLRSPELTIEKSISPTTLVDAGDTLSYIVNVTNVGGASAFETTVRDVLPNGVQSCSVSAQPAGSGDLFSTAGYTLSSTVAPNETISFAYTCVVDVSIQINSTHRNTAYVSWASANGAPHFPEVSDYADFATSPKLSQKSMVSTDQAHTVDAGVGTYNDPRIVSIGEKIRYQLVVTIPEGTSNSAQIIDYLPAGLQYVTGSANVALISDGGISTSLGCTSGNNLQIVGSAVVTPTCGVNPTASSFSSGTDPNFSLGNLVNTDNDLNDEYIVIEFDALVMDNSVNQQARRTFNRFRPRFNGVFFSYSNNVYYRVEEPQLTLATTATATSLNTTTMTVNVANAGNATAFQIAGDDGAPWSVTLQNGLKNINNITLNAVGSVFENGTTTPLTAVDFTVSGINNEILTLNKAFQLDPSAELTVNFDAEIIPGVSPDTTLTTVAFEYASQAIGAPADGVRTGGGISSGTGNTPITDTSILDDYRVESALNVYAISGKVYQDINSDGNHSSGEAGISSVTVVLYDGTTNSCRSVQTNGAGDYAFFPVSPGSYQVIESARQATPTPSQCPPTEQDPSGYASTTANTRSVNIVDSSVDDQDFGDFQGPAFSPNHSSGILPGNVVFYAHEFTTPSDGTVRFIGTDSGATAAGWSYILYRDSDCNGTLDGTEANTPIESINLGVSGGGRLCIINKVYAPNNAPAQDSYRVTTAANFTYSGGSTVDLAVNDVTTVSGTVSPTLPATPATTVTPEIGASRLELRKTVENLTQVTPETESINQAKPGDFLKYRIYYRNTGTGPITDLKVNDSVPAFTAFVLSTESCDSTPAGMICTPVAGLGELRWDFTGSLIGGEGGHVSYQVMVDE